MKRLLTLIVLFLSALTMRAGLNANLKSCPGIVHYIDGHQEEFAKVTIPKAGSKKFNAVTASGEKKTIQSLDVEFLELWRAKNPEESRDVLWCCADTRPDGTRKFLAWSTVLGQGKNISFYAHEGAYVMMTSGLGMQIRNTSPGPTIIYIKPGESGEYKVLGLGSVLLYNSKRLAKKLVEKVISDDPALCKSIQENKWKGRVYELFEQVADIYSPQK